MARDVLQVEVRYAPASPSASDPLAQRTRMEVSLIISADASPERVGAIAAGIISASLGQ